MLEPLRRLIKCELASEKLKLTGINKTVTSLSLKDFE